MFMSIMHGSRGGWGGATGGLNPPGKSNSRISYRNYQFDPPHSAASDLGLGCLPMSHKKDARLIWVNGGICVFHTMHRVKAEYGGHP